MTTLWHPIGARCAKMSKRAFRSILGVSRVLNIVFTFGQIWVEFGPERRTQKTCVDRVHGLDRYHVTTLPRSVRRYAADPPYVAYDSTASTVYHRDLIENRYYVLVGRYYTVEMSKTKLRMLPPLVLGRIIENQNSDFVTV